MDSLQACPWGTVGWWCKGLPKGPTQSKKSLTFIFRTAAVSCTSEAEARQSTDALVCMLLLLLLWVVSYEKVTLLPLGLRDGAWATC